MSVQRVMALSKEWFNLLMILNRLLESGRTVEGGNCLEEVGHWGVTFAVISSPGPFLLWLYSASCPS